MFLETNVSIALKFDSAFRQSLHVSRYYYGSASVSYKNKPPLMRFAATLTAFIRLQVHVTPLSSLRKSRPRPPPPPAHQIRAKLKQLKLSNQAVWDREHARERDGRGIEAPW